MPPQTIIRTRFAPSPSGHLHVGGARTALFCWAYARKHHGKFILRIEDTDQKRSSDAAGMAFLHDLKWLGVEWDEGPEFEGCGGGEAGPYRQSERLDIYRKHLDQLIGEGKAYPAFETPAELKQARDKARQAKNNYRYDRASLLLDAETVKQYLAEGRPHVIRLKVDAVEPVVIRDTVLGEVTVPPEEIDDFVICKPDGYPTYHFAVVVDDELMGVTHVIRGQEHLKNTAKHLLIQEALGFGSPSYAHMSLIFNPDGSKMSKRDKDKHLRRVVKERGMEISDTIKAERWAWWIEKKDHQLDLDEAERLARELGVALPEINVDDFRKAGYLPEVLVNYLALLGWSPGQDIEKFDAEFFVERFDFDRVIKSPAKFDREKLLAFNLDALQQLPPEEFARRYREHAANYHPEFLDQLSEEQFLILGQANQARAKTLDDTFAGSRFFIADDDSIEYELTKAVRKALVNGDPSGFDHLERMLPRLEEIPDWTAHTLENTVKEYAETEAGGKLGKVAQPLRIAVSGGTISPAIFDTLVILGKESVLNRIRRCLTHRSRFEEKVNA